MNITIRSERAVRSRPTVLSNLFSTRLRDENEGKEQAKMLAALVFKREEQKICDIRARAFSRSNFYLVLELPYPVLVEGLG